MIRKKQEKKSAKAKTVTTTKLTKVKRKRPRVRALEAMSELPEMHTLYFSGYSASKLYGGNDR